MIFFFFLLLENKTAFLMSIGSADGGCMWELNNFVCLVGCTKAVIDTSERICIGYKMY